MKNIMYVSLLCLGIAGSTAWAIPSAITYQGTLKEKNIPANGDKNMTFTLVGIDRTAYSQELVFKVHVSSGLFSIPLNFQLVAPYTWETITPYIKVTVEGQEMGPLEPVTATLYSIVAGSVVDGSIGTTKLGASAVTREKLDAVSFQAPGLGFVPAGAILMFDRACPAGWTPYAALNSGRFPMGTGTFSNTSGGNAAHTHSTPNHEHTLATSDHRFGNPAGPVGIVGDSGTPKGTLVGFNNGSDFPARIMRNYTEISGGGETGSGNNLPPYLQVVFCQKS